VWTSTPEEEQQRQRDAAEGFDGFIEKLSEAVEAAKHAPSEDKEWDEFDYEGFLRESDAHRQVPRIARQISGSSDRERLIAGKWAGRGSKRPAEEQDASGSPAGRQAGRFAVAGRDACSDAHRQRRYARCNEADGDFGAAAEILLGPIRRPKAPIGFRDYQGAIKHPLSLRAFEGHGPLAQVQRVGSREVDDDDLARLISEFQITGAKLAGRSTAWLTVATSTTVRSSSPI